MPHDFYCVPLKSSSVARNAALAVLNRTSSGDGHVYARPFCEKVVDFNLHDLWNAFTVEVYGHLLEPLTELLFEVAHVAVKGAVAATTMKKYEFVMEPLLRFLPFISTDKTHPLRRFFDAFVNVRARLCIFHVMQAWNRRVWAKLPTVDIETQRKLYAHIRRDLFLLLHETSRRRFAAMRTEFIEKWSVRTPAIVEYLIR
jgi:hypothetical protein